MRGKEGVAGSPGASVGKAQAPAAQVRQTMMTLQSRQTHVCLLLCFVVSDVRFFHSVVVPLMGSVAIKVKVKSTMLHKRA